MPRLVPCPSCACHVKRSETHCPHCGASLVGRRQLRTRAALALGLTAVVPVQVMSCSDDEERDHSTVSASTKYGGPSVWPNTTTSSGFGGRGDGGGGSSDGGSSDGGAMETGGAAGDGGAGGAGGN
jgi:hypothetical protein